MDQVEITMYKWAGKKFGISIDSDCKECDINSGILHDMTRNEFRDKPVEVTIKPWLSNMWKVLIRGGWHAPVVLVNKKLFSQGRVVDREKLARNVEDILRDK